MDFIQNRLVQQCCSAMATIVTTGVKTWTREVMKSVVKMWSLEDLSVHDLTFACALSMILPLPVTFT